MFFYTNFPHKINISISLLAILVFLLFLTCLANKFRFSNSQQNPCKSNISFDDKVLQKLWIPNIMLILFLLGILANVPPIMAKTSSASSGNELKTMSSSTFRRPLRIAQVGTPWLAIPPKKYGGTERVAYYIIEELVRRGHNVTLFGTADSNTSANLFTHPKFPTLTQRPGSVLWEVYFKWMFEQVRRHADEFDIIQFHTNEHLGSLTHQFVNRTLTTMHYKFDGTLAMLFDTFTQVPLVSISNDQRTHTTVRPRFVDTVYHGIPRDLLTFNPRPGTASGQPSYLAYFGRLVEEKGPDWAIRIAVEAGIPMKIAGKIPNETYWEEVLKPEIDKKPEMIEYIGELDDSEKNNFLGNSLAMVFTSIGFEPFGLVMIEAMACGTPVVALKRGSVPEIVQPGITGLLFNTIAEGVEAVKKVGQLDRSRVRRTFEKRFSVEAMVDGYERNYARMMTEEEEARREQCPNVP